MSSPLMQKMVIIKDKTFDLSLRVELSNVVKLARLPTSSTTNKMVRRLSLKVLF